MQRHGRHQSALREKRAQFVDAGDREARDDLLDVMGAVILIVLNESADDRGRIVVRRDERRKRRRVCAAQMRRPARTHSAAAGA